MSTSILYHAFGIRNVKYYRTNYENGKIIIDAVMTRKLAVCPECKSSNTIYKGAMTRRFRMVPIGGRKVFLDLVVHRLFCLDCGAVRWPQLPFADPRCSYTRAFARFVLELLHHMTITSVALNLGVGWDMVKNIHKQALQRRYKHIRLKDVRYIGIDEFSMKKGRVYMTTVVDLREGRILHAVPGKGGDDIIPFLRTLARKAKKLKAVAMDINNGYIWAVRKILPKVQIVFDHFHISALINRAIDECRREVQAELDRMGRKTIKGCRFLLLQNYESLPEERRARLKRLLKDNHPLLVMHTMKEQLREFWNLEGFKKAEAFLAAWCRDAMNSGIKQLMRVGKTLALYRTGILNYFRHRISSGIVEGINNKIKTMKRQAYGFRDIEYFKLRLYHLHEQRYCLAG